MIIFPLNLFLGISSIWKFSLQQCVRRNFNVFPILFSQATNKWYLKYISASSKLLWVTFDMLFFWTIFSFYQSVMTYWWVLSTWKSAKTKSFWTLFPLDAIWFSNSVIVHFYQLIPILDTANYALICFFFHFITIWNIKPIMSFSC